MFVGFVMAGFFIGWADGTYNHIIDSFTSNRLGHIQIHARGYSDEPSLYKTIERPQRLGEELNSIQEIESWTPRIYTAGLVSVGDKSAGARLVGIDRRRENATTGMANQVVEGRYPSAPGEVMLGRGLARILAAEPGDELAVFSQAADGSVAEELYRVAALLDTGDPELNRSALYLGLDDARALFVLYNQAHEIAVTLHDLRRVEDLSSRLQGQFADSGLEVSPWQEFARDFYRAMQTDKNGMYISLVVVVIVVAITILNTILMSVMERQREYGVLRALGTRPGQIVKMVLSETALLSLASILLGALVTLVLNSHMAAEGIKLEQAVNWGGVQLEYMKGEVNLRSFLLPTLTVLLTSFTVSIFPALKAARTEPAKTMRTF